MKALLWRPIIPFMLLYAADPSINKALWEESCTGYWRILQHVTMSIILILKHDPLNTFWNARVLCNSYRSGSFIGDLPNSMHNLVALPSSLQPGWTCFSQKWGLSPNKAQNATNIYETLSHNTPSCKMAFWALLGKGVV